MLLEVRLTIFDIFASAEAFLAYAFASVMSHKELIKQFLTLQEDRVKAYKAFER